MPASEPLTSSKYFIFLSILSGLVGAFIHPLMSYFLVDELQVAPMFIGVYMVAVTISGLVVSQFFGGLADKGTSSRRLFMLANLGIIFALLIYINTHWFALVLMAGVSLMAIGNASTPQMLTLSRQWASHHPINIDQFNARIRAGISVAWMIGPPLAFTILATVGFTGVFGIAIGIAVIGIIFVWRMIPEQPVVKSKAKHEPAAKASLSFWCITMAVVFASLGNNMYTSSLPLYTIRELELPSYTPGVLMGIVASMEIPVMLLSSRVSARVGKHNLMTFAFCCGVLFYTGIFFAETFWQLLALQVFNALFYGLFAGVGLSLMQELIPKRIGFTSAVYSNAFKIGVMIGASCTGLVAQFFSFQYAMIGAALASVLAILCMFGFRYSLPQIESA